nr:hypothetical protein Itr_chr11CG14630 [Ipomoea trifida]
MVLLPKLFLGYPDHLNPYPLGRHRRRYLLRSLSPLPPHILRLFPQDLPIQPHQHRSRRHHTPHHQAQLNLLRQKP